MEKRRNNKRSKRKIGIVLMALVIAITAGCLYFLTPRFDQGTTINGVSCSMLTVKQAKELLEESMQDISFLVAKSDGEASCAYYTPSDEQIQSFKLVLQDQSEIENLMEAQQGNTKQGPLHAEVAYSVNQEAVKEYLLTIPELNEKKQVPCENATLQIAEDNTVQIVAAKYGNQIAFSAALDFAIEALSNGKNQVNFVPIMVQTPEILSNDEVLLQNQEEITTYLQAVINYKLPDGQTQVIDAYTIKTWLVKDENIGTFRLDETRLQVFVENIEEALNKMPNSATFNATEIGRVTLSDEKMKYDEENDLKKIRECIYSGETCTISPINCYDNLSTYIEVDIARQKVWMYKEGECILETDCVSGLPTADRKTRTGIFFIKSKTRNVTLTDHKTYWTFVKYWMPFDGGIGFHDASWREKNGKEYFGGQIYLTNGSHGCVNLPTWAAEIVYQNIDKSMPIIVYNSSVT